MFSEMSFRNFGNIFLCIFAFHLQLHVQESLSLGSCDYFHGNWVYDKSLPLYNNNSCPFIRKFINCQSSGRPDTEYQKYLWQPKGCNLARFDGLDILKRYRGKHIMFVGDSLTLNQYESFICLLYNSAANLKYALTRVGDISTLTFLDYDLKVSMDNNHFFVDIIPTKKGRMLDLDSIEDGKNWLGVDMLIFNTWHWWFYTKPSQPWDYVIDGKNTVQDLNRMYMFARGINTWAKWVDANINSNKTRVFYQGISPDHYHGADWGQPKASCLYQKTPILGSTFPASYPAVIVNDIRLMLNKMKTPVTLLDITGLSMLRKDGHPSIYTGTTGMDCSHWCLSGVPDTWNQILYSIIIFQ